MNSSFVGDHGSVKDVMTLSTNCLYYDAYHILERMEGILGKREASPGYAKRAEALKEAINRFFWREKAGTYSYLLYPDGRRDHSRRDAAFPLRF